MLTRDMGKKFLAGALVIAPVTGFSWTVSAQSIQAQTQAGDAQSGVQTDGFGLSIGESEATRRYCGAGALNVYNVWINNGATAEQAIVAYDEYFNNCQCAKYGGSYCK